ncbi:MAG TPA: cupredoxin domain-containing protein [Nitrososphaerales archaeon]
MKGSDAQISARKALSSAGVSIILLLLGLGVVAIAYVDSTQGTADQISAQNQQITSLKSQLQQLASRVSSGQGGPGANLTLPVMNQVPTIRSIRETWYLSPSAHQDRFEPSFIIVNQGDTINLILIENDTVAHDLVLGPPYNIIVNATVPGLVNDLTQQKFTTPAKNNSPGVVVTGTPGNVSATYSFLAKYSGIYEFVCTYHAQMGMIGYLAVLPNSAYSPQTTRTTSGQSPKSAAVAIIQGAGTNTSSKGFFPSSITVVLGTNNTVVWNNKDNSPHTVTANDGGFDSGNMAPGQSFSFTFTAPGTYTYHCTYHPWMVASVVVKTG